MTEEAANTEINVADLDQGFAEEVSRLPGGAEIFRCFACGMCTSGCPVREVDDRYSPRRLIRMILLGMREEVLKSDFLWLCTNCFTCMERCPQNIQIPNLIRAVKNLAADEGYLPGNLKVVAESISEIGRLYEIEEFDNKKRAKSDLPALAQTLADVKELLEKKRQQDG